MVLDELARRASLGLKAHKGNALVGEGRIVMGGPRLILAKPLSFMNLSGGPVSSLAKFYRIEPSHVIVVHDELDVPFDTLRLKVGGGHGGNNGIRDIISALGTGDFVRVRVGIGRPPGRQDAASFVLKDFSADEKKVLPNLLSDAADAVELITEQGLAAAQLKFHTAPPA